MNGQVRRIVSILKAREEERSYSIAVSSFGKRTIYVSGMAAWEDADWYKGACAPPMMIEIQATAVTD